MRRILLASLLLTVLASGPSLCLAGVLEHACGQHEPVSCDHEDGCTADPCQDMVPAPPFLRARPPHGAACVPTPAFGAQAPVCPPPSPQRRGTLAADHAPAPAPGAATLPLLL